MKLAALLLVAAQITMAQMNVRYWPGEHEKAVFAEWAMQAWARASGGLLRVEKVDTPEQATIRFRWLEPHRRGLYGQSLATRENGVAIFEIVINSSITSLGTDMAAAARRDPLFADVILFLTCVHEAGHALGPEHTRDFADIMYSFEHGGDFVGYFNRYRQKLTRREDMSRISPLSEADARQIRDWASGRKQNEKR
jgi:hypothetical protein